MSEIVPKESYTRAEVRRLLSVSERQLRAWENHNLIRPTQSFAFADMIALRTLVKLRKSRVPAAQIRLALASLREKMRGVADPLREMKVVSEGKKMRVEIQGQQMEPLSGQLFFNFNEVELRRLLSFPVRKQEQQIQKENAELYFQKGLDLEQKGAPIDEAIAAYETAARLDPTSAGALVNLGTIYFNARSWAKAESHYRRALEIDPDYPLAHFNVANLYDEKGDYTNAMKHYKTAVTLHPNYADAHYNLALLYQGSGQMMEAVRHWKTYLKLDPASTWSAVARRELAKLTKSAIVHGHNAKTLHRMT